MINSNPEIWKLLIDYPNYEVSNWGRIRSIDHDVLNGYGIKRVKGRIKKPNTRIKDKSNHVTLRALNGKIKKEKISRLVYREFNGPLMQGLVIDHHDNNPLNDYYENLKQITQRVNNSKDRKNKTSKYTGVSLNKARYNRGLTKCWASAITINHKKLFLGYFESEEMAGKAYLIEFNKLEKHELNQ